MLARYPVASFFCALLLGTNGLWAADWSALKIGMTPAETMGALGEPLIRTSGQGFDIWIYDNQAEAVFYGPLVGWTSPRTATAQAQTVDVWQAAAPGSPTSVQVLPRPLKIALSGKRRGKNQKTTVYLYR